jgi:hypothetical protein
MARPVEMICKECRPVFEHEIIHDRKAMPIAPIIVKHVELCPRHAEMEQRRITEVLHAATAGEEAKERRRYALLQAAAMIYLTTANHARADAENVKQAVTCAEGLLTEIEKREKEGQS